MSKLDELYRLHHLLDGRRTGISRDALIRNHGFSRSTLTRLIADLRDRLGAPLIVDRERGGYRYDTADGRHHLPGLWFSSEELAALVTLNQLLQTLQPGLLDDHLAPLKDRVEKIMDTEHLGSGEATKRIRILSMASRARDMKHFQTAAGAVLQRKRLRIEYYNRERNETGTREVSPQRLTHYRDNWYLDAWCHLKKDLRIFSVECIRTAEQINKPAKAVPESTLDKTLASAYGIFAGKPKAVAVLRFTPKRARWIADETWHPQQKTLWLDDGRFELAVPYSDTQNPNFTRGLLRTAYLGHPPPAGLLSAAVNAFRNPNTLQNPKQDPQETWRLPYRRPTQYPGRRLWLAMASTRRLFSSMR